jgi:hypothetical protein
VKGTDEGQNPGCGSSPWVPAPADEKLSSVGTQDVCIGRFFERRVAGDSRFPRSVPQAQFSVTRANDQTGSIVIAMSLPDAAQSCGSRHLGPTHRGRGEAKAGANKDEPEVAVQFNLHKCRLSGRLREVQRPAPASTFASDIPDVNLLPMSC